MKASSRCRIFLATAVLLLLATQLSIAANSPGTPKFGSKWSGLVGEWKAEGGQGSGICGFHFELTEHVIVRTNHAQLSAGAAAHEDLMVISPDASPDKARAIYFDNEGHTIDYAAEWSSDGNTLTFSSKPGPGPQFRLVYKKLESDVFIVSFDMAPPGQPGTFKPYASGKIRRSGK